MGDWPKVTDCGGLKIEVHHPKCILEQARQQIGEGVFFPEIVRRSCDCATWEAAEKIDEARSMRRRGT